MRLQLRRPLAFLDLESTGVSPARDRIVEIAVLKLHPDGREEFRCKRVNPTVPIPPEATDVHRITDADVVDEPPFAAYAKGINDFLSDCDFAGFGIRRFDLPLLRAELWRTKRLDFRWRDRAVIDAMSIYHDKQPRDLAAAVRQYCGRDFLHAHSAEEDVRATLDVLRAQLEHHVELPGEIEELHALYSGDTSDWLDHEGHFVWVSEEVTVAFGKHRGRLLRQVVTDDPDYLEWLVEGDFEPETKEIVRRALQGDYPRP